MKVEFFDRQDESNPLNGAQIGTDDELSSIIESLRTRPPFLCELIGENGHNLMVGIGDDIGCVQHSSCDGLPPYLMGTKDAPRDTNNCVDFLIGDTPTPIPRRYCLPMELVKRIASDFVDTGERSADVHWEEI
jgi:hypothetical protein